MATDEILNRYRSSLDDILSGGGRLEAILRRGAIYDSLAAGTPSGQTPTPQYGGPVMATGAPQSSAESLSDAMAFVQSLTGGAPYDPAAIDATRRGQQIDVQRLLDERETRRAGAIAEGVASRDVAGVNLAQAGVQGVLGLGEQEDARRRVMAEQEMAGEKLASESLIADLDRQNKLEAAIIAARGGKSQRPVVVAPGGMLFDPEGKKLAEVPARDESSLLSPEELAQELQLRAASRSPGVSVSYGAPVQGIGPGGEPMYYQPNTRGGLEPTGIAPVSVANAAREAAIAKERAKAQVGRETAVVDAAATVIPNLKELRRILKRHIKGPGITGPVVGKLPNVTEDSQRASQLIAQAQLEALSLLKGSPSDRDLAKAIQASINEDVKEEVNIRAINAALKKWETKAGAPGESEDDVVDFEDLP